MGVVGIVVDNPGHDVTDWFEIGNYKDGKHFVSGDIELGFSFPCNKIFRDEIVSVLNEPNSFNEGKMHDLLMRSTPFLKTEDGKEFMFDRIMSEISKYEPVEKENIEILAILFIRDNYFSIPETRYKVVDLYKKCVEFSLPRLLSEISVWAGIPINSAFGNVSEILDSNHSYSSQFQKVLRYAMQHLETDEETNYKILELGYSSLIPWMIPHLDYTRIIHSDMIIFHVVQNEKLSDEIKFKIVADFSKQYDINTVNSNGESLAFAYFYCSKRIGFINQLVYLGLEIAATNKDGNTFILKKMLDNIDEDDMLVYFHK
eukprot:TRINITY_DN4100_c0_g1_i1.p1 TRINITY_DN4100_c0_g1~~TRINITY_DN4100_c0_g1_i1.p1  ORF type:complete len:316 (-),score=69.98 TRINITY_DN4100_c0_g1_i1:453-1400(-)